MAISTRERNILVLAGVVGSVFLATQVFPGIRAIYDEREQELEAVRLEISREQRLIEDTVIWRERRVEVEAMLAELEEQIFEGATVPLVEANIQAALTQHARDSGMTVSATRLAERLETDGWLVVSQEMSFRTNDQNDTIRFLRKLEESAPRLRVSDFSLDRNRAQFSGSITVVGFARLGEGLTEEISQVAGRSR